MSDYTAEELEGLSEEERLAIMDDDDAPEPEVDDEVIEKEEVVEPEVEPEVVEPELEPEPEKAEVKEPSPIKSVLLPDDIAEAFGAQLAELNQKYEDGDIELSALLDGRDKINRQIYNAEVDQAEKNSAAESWKTAQDDFFAANKHYFDDKARYDNLDLCVKAVAAANSEPTFARVLEKARKMEEAMAGVQTVKTKDKLPPSPRPKAPNLGDLPAAATNDDQGEFAFMDKLTGLEYEAALEKMSEVQLARFLNS